MSNTTTTRALILAAIAGLFLSVLSTAHGQTANSAESLESSEGASTGASKAFPGIDAGAEPESIEAGSVRGETPSVADLEPSETPESNPAKDDPTGTASEIYSALKGGQWLLAFGGFLMFLVWGLRMFLGRWVDWVNTKKGGFVLALGTSILLGLGTALVAGGELGFGLFASVLAAKWTAAGAWGHAKDIFGK